MSSNVVRHPFHLVDPSPWPFFTGFGALFVTFGGVMYMHGYGSELLVLGFILLLLCLFQWWRDVVREGTFQGLHTAAVQRGLKYGVLIFILTEVMFFVAFFWGFFHSSLSPSIEIGNVWPPVLIDVLNPWEVPLINTLILLLSGVTVTWAHHSIVGGHRSGAVVGLTLTVVLAIIFTALQVFEYNTASFDISDGIYGSTFYMSTGFHGFHVLIGTSFLAVCLLRQLKNHFTTDHHFGFEAAAWYWHFVDVVWLFLFTCVYWWGNL
uniref:Cytochrome c oxidase subunit 3 n=1 Tax=Ophirina amphinema TaxID=2108040 RepID=A0A348AYQ7_9EUKA|nr:cytochrome c oxidase subunit 3 [Ophirina amphinema]